MPGKYLHLLFYLLYNTLKSKYCTRGASEWRLRGEHNEVPKPLNLFCGLRYSPSG